MAYTCPKCGWKHKPSQEKYYQSRGLPKPTCIDCNPSFSQKVKKRYVAFVIGSFTNTYIGYGPLASIPYFPVLFLLSIGVAFASSQALSIVLSFIFFITGYIGCAIITQYVGEKIGQRLARDQPIFKLVIAYYLPLFVIVLGAAIFWWVKIA